MICLCLLHEIRPELIEDLNQNVRLLVYGLTALMFISQEVHFYRRIRANQAAMEGFNESEIPQKFEKKIRIKLVTDLNSSPAEFVA